ncbi:MAG: sulfatase [Verrucomicrobiales bacterium]|nr:sulfatase [Verrucomicrobiales bacterium]
MKRFLVSLLCISSLLSVYAKESPPNILFIMSDDHAAHAISAYGSKLNKTPNIDRIAKDGALFKNCFVVNSICTPSRAAILTGKYSHKNGVPVFNRFDGSQWNVAKELQKAGYHTGMIGKWHLGSDPTGFDYWTVLPGQGKYHDPVFIEMGETKKFKGGYATDLIGDFSLQFLENRPKDKPFYLMCHHKAPHRPWEPDAKHQHMYDDVDFPEPATFNDDYSGRGSAAKEAEMRIDRDLTPNDLKQEPPPGLTPAQLKHWKYERYMHDYLACIASVDDNVGRVLDYLEKHDLAKNTIVIYTSDQGFYLGDHNWFDKRFMYEESLRMPFVIRYPGHIKPKSTNDKMILNVDFAPTFLEYAGLKTPPEVQGHSIVPLLEGKTPKDWRKSMYYRYYHYPADHKVQPHWGVRTDRYKLIYFNKIKEWELYDLQADPHELKSVYEDPKYAKIRAELTQEIERLRKELDDRDQFADIQK